jgi:hypothetical protein
VIAIEPDAAHALFAIIDDAGGAARPAPAIEPAPPHALATIVVVDDEPSPPDAPDAPSDAPSAAPSDAPPATPSTAPSAAPSAIPSDAPSAAPFGPFGPIEHLLAELRRLDLLLLHSLPRLRRTAAGEAIPATLAVTDDDPAHSLIAHAAATRTAVLAAQAAGTRLPLLALCRNLRLDDAAVGVLMLAIAPHVARHYEDVFAWLQGDAALRAPQLDLALALLATTTADRLRLREQLAAGPLLSSGFVWLADPPDGPRLAEPARLIVASPRLLRFLCDHPGAEPEVEAVRARPPLPPTTAALERALEPLRDPLRVALASGTAARSAAPVAVIQTEDGASALAGAARLADELGHPALLVDLCRLGRLAGSAGSAGSGGSAGSTRPTAIPSSVEATLKAVFDEARLQRAVLAIAGYDDLPAATRDAALAATAGEIERFDGPVLVIVNAPFDLRHELAHRAVVTLAVAPPDADERAALWRDQLGRRPTAATDLVDLARSFRLGASQIRDGARLVATLDDTAGARPEHLRAAGRAQSRHQLGDLAQVVAPWGRWQDLVVPQSSVERLRDIIDALHHRETVFATWGLGGKVAVWRRVTALFAGPPGTGKTLSASLIAQALGLDLYRIDLSSVVSKYIGETEKNLDRVFRAAHRSNAILFFDEADALFGKRTDVKDAHDRYANVETSYLLQKLESFEGLAILATNYKKNLDAAFLRRIDVVVDFPMPGKDERRRLWRTLVPEQMPLGPDVDLDFLADRFELSGGLIMNAIQAAATRAAAAHQPIGMVPLLRGVRDELHKQGKLISRDDLGPFAQLLDPPHDPARLRP